MYSFNMGEHTVYATKKKFSTSRVHVRSQSLQVSRFWRETPNFKTSLPLDFTGLPTLAHLSFSLRLDILSVEYSVWVVFFNELPTFYDF